MLLDLRELVVGELARLVEDEVRDRELADVVQQAGAAHVAARPASKPRTSPIATAISATRAEWLAVNGDFASITRANARRSGRCARRPRRARGRGAPRRRRRARRERGPEAAVAADRLERAHERGVEPAPARRRATAARPHAARGVEDLGRLGQAEDAREQRDLLPAQAVGIPRPSQCSSSERIAAAVSSERKSMRAISAPRSQRASMNLRVTSPSSLIALRSRRGRAASRRARPCAATSAARPGRLQSTSFDVRFAAWSSAPNSAAMRSALAEQPASLSSRP